MTAMGMPVPIESVYCSCGAQWHGKTVVKAAANIRAHEARWKTHHATCWSVPHDWFRRRFRCVCEACGIERMEQRLAKRPAKVNR